MANQPKPKPKEPFSDPKFVQTIKILANTPPVTNQEIIKRKKGKSNDS